MSDKTVKPDIIGLTASLIVWGLKKLKNNSGIMDVVKATHLQNKEKEAPILIKEHPTETGTDYVFALPAGVDKVDFEKHRHYFETYTNSIVEIQSEGRKLTLSTHKNSYEDKIKFAFDPAAHTELYAPCPIGKTPSGETIVVDFASLPHMMVGGQTGYGKTSFLLNALVSLLLSGVKVSVIDLKGVDFPRFSPWVNLALDNSQAEELLQNHVFEMKRRIKLIANSGCQNYAEYRKKHDVLSDSFLPYLVLFVDELTQIKNKKCFEYLNDLVVLSRVAGFSLVLATQRPSAKLWDGFSDVRSQLAGAMCFYVRDSTDSQIVLGSGNTRGAELPKKPGRAIWNNDDDTMVQTMYLSASEAYTILSERVPKEVYKLERAVECEERLPT